MWVHNYDDSLFVALLVSKCSILEPWSVFGLFLLYSSSLATCIAVAHPGRKCNCLVGPVVVSALGLCSHELSLGFWSFGLVGVSKMLV